MNKQGFLATFRVDEDLWGKFRAIAKDHKTNASALIVSYIESVVNAGEVSDFGVASISCTDTLSIQQIDLMIDERIKSLQQSTNSISVQDIDKSIDERLEGIENRVKKLVKQNSPVLPDEWELTQLIRKEIANSLEEGDIAAELKRNRENLINNLNEFDKRLVEVEAAVIGEKKAEPTITEPEPTTTEPEPTTTEPEPTTTEPEPTTTLTEDDKAEIIKALGIEKIVDGTDGYSSGSNEIFDLIQKNRNLIKSKLGIEIVTTGYQIKNLNNILPALGYEVQPKQPKNENGKRIKTYFVVGTL